MSEHSHHAILPETPRFLSNELRAPGAAIDLERVRLVRCCIHRRFKVDTSMMKFLYVAGDVLRSRSLSSDAKLVFAAISFLARLTGICSSTYQEIGDTIGLDKRVVMHAVGELKKAGGFLVPEGGGNGTPCRFSIPAELVHETDRYRLGTGDKTEPVPKTNQFTNSTGPLPKSHRTTTESVPPYKEETNNNKKPASEDAESSPASSDLQEKWFDEEFWPSYWRKQDRAEAQETFKRHALSVAKKDRIVAALKAQAPEMLQRNVHHRPYAATWLDKRRYDDDLSGVQFPSRDAESLYEPAEDPE